MLNTKQIAQFNQDGFLVVENILPKESLAAVDTDIAQRLDELAAHLGAPVNNRVASINDKMLALENHKPGAALTFVHSYIMSPALFSLWTSDLLLGMAQSLMGPDIDGHPFWSLRPKPPEMDLFVVPWHQDSAYLMAGAYTSKQLTFWIPLMDVNTKNGCMELARGEHRKGKEFPHTPENYIEHGNRSWYLEIDPRVSETFTPVRCEITRGSLIIFSHLTPHRSLVNTSSGCRWSVDLRYLAAGAFAGTQQAPIPFSRKEPTAHAEALRARAEYIEKQGARDRTVWRYEIKEAKWKDRWAEKAQEAV